MTFDAILKEIIQDTAGKTVLLQRRMAELVAILNIIHAPLTSQPDQKLVTDDGTYDFDDLLVMIFELVQLMAAFQRFPEAQQSLTEFLVFHASRLTNLCLEGRLNHTAEVIDFK